MRLRLLLAVIAASQFVLGALTLFAAGPFFAAMGLTRPPADNGYMLAMLGARFLAYGLGMAVLARSARPSRFWLQNMVMIQALDFAAGVFYLGGGIISPATAALPMINAAIFAVLLMLWMPGRRAGISAG